MKKIIRMYPAFDKRDETLNYGRHGEELFRLLTEQGDEGIWNEFERLEVKMKSLENEEFKKVALRNPYVYNYVNAVFAGKYTEDEALQSMVISLVEWGENMQREIHRLLDKQAGPSIKYEDKELENGTKDKVRTPSPTA